MILRKNSSFVAILVLFLVLHGCGKPAVLTGDMFLVTNNRSNIPLGAATIYFVDEQNAVSYFSKLIGDKRAANNLELDKISAQLEDEKIQCSKFSDRLGMLVREIEQAKERLIQAALMDKDYEHIFEREGNFSIGRRDYFVDLLVENPLFSNKPYVIELHKLLEERHLNFIENLSCIERIQAMGDPLKRIADTNEFLDVMLEIHKLTKVNDGKITVYTTKTDASGKFNISLEKNSYWAFAYEERVGLTGKKEIYIWALKVEVPKDKTLQLTSLNMGESDFIDLINKRLKK